MFDPSKYTDMIVDDEKDIRDVLGERLRNVGYQTMEASTSDEALELVATIRPDLILLDVMMQGMGGFDVCNALRDRPATKATPVIFLSAVNDPPLKDLGRQLGAAEYLTKPCSLRQMATCIEATLLRGN